MAASKHHQDLIEGCLQGNAKAQFMLYSAYSKAMYNICRRMMNDEQEAEDVLQTAFVDVFTKMESFKGKSTIGAWIKRIVINKCINQLKKRKLLYVDLGRVAETVHDEKDEFEDYALTISGVKKAIDSLSHGYKTVFTLYAIEGYDHEEISNILDINISTSKSQYSRAKKRIIQNIKEQEAEALNIN